jgi:hypothetical protein
MNAVQVGWEMRKHYTDDGMKDFEVHFTSHVVIKAKDFADAKIKFSEQYHDPICATSFFDYEANESKDVIGHSELSELPIFHDEEFSHDPETGVMWLKSEEDEEVLVGKPDTYPECTEPPMMGMSY